MLLEQVEHKPGSPVKADQQRNAQQTNPSDGLTSRCDIATGLNEIDKARIQLEVYESMIKDINKKIDEKKGNLMNLIKDY